MNRWPALALVAVATAGLGFSTGAAAAGPNCYETGPGYQKCVDGSTGGYFSPIYQGPKVFNNGSIPWVPTYSPPPIFVPPAAPAIPAPAAQSACAPGSYVDPNNLSSCLPATPGNDYVALAVPVSRPGLAMYGTGSSQASANQIAIAQCVTHNNSTCQVQVSARHACVALALDPTGRFVGGVGPDLATASAKAMDAAPGGQAAGGYCADPPEN